MAKKGAMPNFETVDDYIANQTPEAQKVLKELRSLIKQAAPDAEEVLNYKVPTFKLVPGNKKDQQIMIAAYSKFVSFYPFQSTIEEFEDELKDYKKGKGTVKFYFDEEIPEDLIIEMVKFRREEVLKALK